LFQHDVPVSEVLEQREMRRSPGGGYSWESF
jgi:hypothetical protein